jgi:hypothetical protein
MNNERINSRSDAPSVMNQPGVGDDVACVNCGEVALDTGLECDECGWDNSEVLTGKKWHATKRPIMTEQPEAQRLADEMTQAIQQADAEDSVIDVARWFVEDSAAELRRLEHNNQLLMNALMKACGDDEEMVKEIIESQGELK